jgi:hypothetical protein
MHQMTEKVIIEKTVFMRNLSMFFYNFSKYHLKFLLGDFNAKVGRESILKLTIGNESLHQYSNDNVIRIVHFAISKNVVVKSTKTFTSTIGPLLFGRLITY